MYSAAKRLRVDLGPVAIVHKGHAFRQRAPEGTANSSSLRVVAYRIPRQVAARRLVLAGDIKLGPKCLE